jgi:hypothetical protein
MKRIWLKFLNTPAFIFLVAIAIAIQTSLFNSYPIRYFEPDFVLLAVIWCALRRTFTEGGVLTLIFSIMVESHSSSPQGFYMICYMAIYLGIRVFSRFFVISQFASLISVTMGSSIALKVVHLLVVYSLSLLSHQWRHTLIQLLPSAGMAGLMGLWVYKALDRFDQATFKTERSRQLVEDELLVEEGL